MLSFMILTSFSASTSSLLKIKRFRSLSIFNCISYFSVYTLSLVLSISDLTYFLTSLFIFLSNLSYYTYFSSFVNNLGTSYIFSVGNILSVHQHFSFLINTPVNQFSFKELGDDFKISYWALLNPLPLTLVPSMSNSLHTAYHIKSSSDLTLNY